MYTLKSPVPPPPPPPGSVWSPPCIQIYAFTHGLCTIFMASWILETNFCAKLCKNCAKLCKIPENSDTPYVAFCTHFVTKSRLFSLILTTFLRNLQILCATSPVAKFGVRKRTPKKTDSPHKSLICAQSTKKKFGPPGVTCPYSPPGGGGGTNF